MQTMTFCRAKAVTRTLMFVCSVATVIAGLLSLAGAAESLICVFPFGLMYLFICLLRLLESLEGKEKAPGRTVRPGA